MILKLALFIFAVSSTTGLETGLRLLFPLQKQYIYDLKTNVSIGTEPRSEKTSTWLMSGELRVQAYDNYSKARLYLNISKKTVIGNETGYNSTENHYLHGSEGDKFLREPWELDYQDNGFIKSIYVGEEPTWAVNLKRAISVNLQLTRSTGPGSSETYSMNEPCLDEMCVMVYTVKGNSIKKYTSLRIPTTKSSYSWGSVPWTSEYPERRFVDSISSAERIYELDNERGMLNLDLKSAYLYKTHDHILSVNTDLSLSFKEDLPSIKIDKLNLSQTTIQYVAGDFSDPTNGIANSTEFYLATKCYTILLKIARKGIDADNIVRNASLIHNMDFIELLNTMSQLKYESLIKLFNDLVLSTSYDMETSRNIFLEILPHVRSDACARFIKYLVLEEKESVEDAALLSLIRKLPFNVATHSQHLLEELEVLTKLGLDFSPDIRHSGILSFATLMHKTMEASQVKQDYFDGVVVKYFRMYSDCPRYLDKMVWLQGLCNIGYSAEAYTRIVAADRARPRHERLWAALAGSPKTEEPYMVLETTLPILTNETEDIQLRIIALHSFLSSPNVRETDFLFVHNYITSCNCKHLKRFWYSTVKNMDLNRDFTGYRVSSFYIPFIANQVSNPDPLYWATNNYIISGQEEDGAPSLQAISIADELGALPAFIGLRVFTGGRRPYKAAVYFIVEGVISKVHEYKELYDVDPKTINAEKLLEVLKNIKTWKKKKAEKLHIDVVVKIHDKTVYATHLNETRFKSWNEEDYKYIVDFLRFGSHINQQIVYYPFQTDVHIPTELGTPIRLQSTILSFTSIRGNLTAPSDEDITWRNDLHIRYQGTAVTTLSTAAPLVGTVHVARIQQSLVAHLPMKFNVSLSSTDKSLVLTWPNPGDQQAGVAMHSRAEVSTETNNGGYDFLLEKGGVEIKKDSIFFDCKRPMTGAEVINKLLASNTKHHDFFHSIQPSLVVLNGLVLFSSPPSGSCGVIIQPTVTASDDVLEVRIHLENLSFIKDVLKAEMWFRLKYFSQGDPENIFMKVEADAKMERREGTTEYELTFHGHQPNATNPIKKEWRIRLTGQERLHTSFFKDISSDPAAYEGSMTLAFTGNQAEPVAIDSELLVKYEGQPGIEGRKFVVRANGKNFEVVKGMVSRIFRPPALGRLRMASVEDAPMIMDLMNESMSKNFRIECLSDVVYLIENSVLSICQLDVNDMIVGFLSAREYPLIPSVHPKAWEEYIWSKYKSVELNSRNTLFLHMLCWNGMYARENVDSMLKSVFMHDPYVQYIAMLSKTGFLESELISQTTWGQLLKAYSRDPINITAIIKGNNGVSSVNINNATQVQLESGSFSWLLDRWTDMQIKKNFGFYRECILNWPYIQTLSGDTSLQGTQDLLLADCRDEKPRFAVLVVPEGIKIYSGGYSVLIHEQLGIDETNAGDRFIITKEDNNIKITLKQTNIIVYSQSDTKSILVPRLYMGTVCGACADGDDLILD